LKKLLFLFGSGFLIYKIIQKTGLTINETVNSLVFSPAGLSMDWSNPLNPQIIVIVKINNPSKMDFTIQSIFLTLTLNDGTVLGTVNMNSPIAITANTNKSINLPISVNGSNILQLIATNAIVNQRNIKIEGYYYVSGVKLPYSNNLNFI
jgi:LEA14-like dessication related protein